MATGIGDFLVWFNRRRLAELVEKAGGEWEAEMLVCQQTGLQPSEYHAKTVGGRIRYLKRALRADDQVVEEERLPPLTPEDMTILEALKAEHPMTVTQEELATITRLSDRAVRDHVHYLEGENLINRPRGPKKGYGLTASGIALLDRR